MTNIDKKTVESFGDEWSRFDQSKMSSDESKKIFHDYFKIFPWSKLPINAVGFDMGCGTGRWAKFVASRVGHLNCIDPSSAITVAKKNLNTFNNISFFQASVDERSVEIGSQDFGYSLGVLHHIPDTRNAIQSCVELLKPNAPLLIYLYYAFDGRPLWFKVLWKISDWTRKVIYHLPPSLKNLLTNIIAAVIYWPLARFSLFLEKCRISTQNIPLSYYKNCSFYTMKTDSRDRVGTPLEQRFTKDEIESMLDEAGLHSIKFSKNAPYWCAIGYAKDISSESKEKSN